MKSKIIFLFLVISANFSSFASKPKIVASITPIASIVSMLVKDIADIETIDVSSGCPHHYQMRPSDKAKINNANIFIYLDEGFDGFAAKLTSNFHGRVIKISDLKTVNFLGRNGKINWHFWLDLKNVLNLQEEISDILLTEFPNSKDVILANKTKSQKQIYDLIKIKQEALGNINNLVVLTDSLEHFLLDINNGYNIKDVYQKQNASLKNISKLESELKLSSTRCIVIDSSQNIELYEKFNKKIVQIDSENWLPDKGNKNYAELFYNKYLKMILQLREC
ncbi:zinc ABC transporter substrate-binding protein [Rickettsiaceae bacterium]|nr:zinc ABC transporter substrate-binding protein [Rickettsiaceae bacterium]